MDPLSQCIPQLSDAYIATEYATIELHTHCHLSFEFIITCHRRGRGIHVSLGDEVLRMTPATPQVLRVATKPLGRGNASGPAHI